MGKDNSLLLNIISDDAALFASSSRLSSSSSVPLRKSVSALIAEGRRNKPNSLLLSPPPLFIDSLSSDRFATLNRPRRVAGPPPPSSWLSHSPSLSRSPPSKAAIDYLAPFINSNIPSLLLLAASTIASNLPSLSHAIPTLTAPLKELILLLSSYPLSSFKTFKTIQQSSQLKKPIIDSTLANFHDTSISHLFLANSLITLPALTKLLPSQVLEEPESWDDDDPDPTTTSSRLQSLNNSYSLISLDISSTTLPGPELALLLNSSVSLTLTFLSMSNCFKSSGEITLKLLSKKLIQLRFLDISGNDWVTTEFVVNLNWDGVINDGNGIDGDDVKVWPRLEWLDVSRCPNCAGEWVNLRVSKKRPKLDIVF